MLPPKLQPGDELRIISPSTSMAVTSAAVRQIALETLQSSGFRVSFAKNTAECDIFSSSSIASRVEDIHDAFLDPNVKGILTTLGGYNCNQLLRYLDYDLIRTHPKVFCGFSDITALENAIYTKTGLVTYSGPHFSTFGMKKGLEYTLKYFKQCLTQSNSYKISPSEHWSDDSWYRDQENRTFESNPGFLILNPGRAEGTLLGGNLCTLNLLQGTEYMPSLTNSILLLEDDDESKPLHFDRDLQSLLHQPEFGLVKGIIIGRFQRASQMTAEKLTQMIRNKPELANIPIIANADFGHTTPQFTFPIGGQAKLVVEEDKATFTIIRH
jgi:muramoyltetrapeptide carboxypeptidase